MFLWRGRLTNRILAQQGDPFERAYVDPFDRNRFPFRLIAERPKLLLRPRRREGDLRLARRADCDDDAIDVTLPHESANGVLEVAGAQPQTWFQRPSHIHRHVAIARCRRRQTRPAVAP